MVKVGMSSIRTKMVLRYGCGILLPEVHKALPRQRSHQKKIKEWCML